MGDLFNFAKVIDDLHLMNKHKQKENTGGGVLVQVCGVVRTNKTEKDHQTLKIMISFLYVIDGDRKSFNFYFSFCCLKHVWKWNICDTEISSIGSICDTEISSVFFCRFWEGFPRAYAPDTLLYISGIIARTVLSYQTLQSMSGS